MGRPKKDPSILRKHVTATISPELGKDSKAFYEYRSNPLHLINGNQPTYSDCVELGLRMLFGVEKKETIKSEYTKINTVTESKVPEQFPQSA